MGELYNSQYKVAADLNRWNDKTKADNLVVSLRGATQQLLSNITDEDKRNYQKLVELDQRFGRAHFFAPIRRRELKYHQQACGESLQALSSKVLNLAHQAHPEATALTVQQIALEALVDGIFHWKVQHQVRILPCKTLKEALSCALEIEVARKALLCWKTFTTVKQVRAVKLRGGVSFIMKKGISG